MPRFVAVVLFLWLTAEGEKGYIGDVHTPLTYADTILFQPSALKLPLWTYIQIGILIACRGRGKAPAKPVGRALLSSALCVAAWVALGSTRGGDLNQAGFQVFAYLNGLLFAATLAAVMRTPAHHALLHRTVAAAAVYRGLVAIFLYLFVVRDLPVDKVPETLTDHDDSVLFVAGIVILVVGALLRVSPRARRAAQIGAPVIVLAVVLNNRRLAWVSLLGAAAAIYACLPKGPQKRAVNRAALWVIPVLAIYTAVGWGRTERVFKPLAAFASMSSEKDASTRSRDNENDGLIYTFSQSGALGTGFGIQYIETDTTLSARGFTQYRYVPHNSVLALLAFTGIFGVAGIFWPLLVAVFLNVRTTWVAKDPRVRAAAMVGVAIVAIAVNQMYGDMGFFSAKMMAIVAVSLAAAARLAPLAGAWGAGMCQTAQE